MLRLYQGFWIKGPECKIFKEAHLRFVFVALADT